MILMAVGRHDAPNFIRIPLHKGEIRQNQVHTRHVSIWECHAAVYDNHVILTFKNRKVLAHFIETAQEIGFDRWPCLAAFGMSDFAPCLI